MADGGMDIVKISDPDYQPDSTSVLGSGGTYVYTITGLEEGSTDLEFAYSQNSADTIVSDFKFHVEVAADLSVTITQVF
jgi:predicted secreted protein